jgi:uncharacterized protein involved in tolerance to divalent cations
MFLSKNNHVIIKNNKYFFNHIKERVGSMKQYEKPIFIEEELELVDVIAVSSEKDGASVAGVSADDLWI